MISIFKTSIESRQDLRRLAPYLKAVESDIQWTVDMEDCDRILRVESDADRTDQIALVLNSHGFLCITLAKFEREPDFSFEREPEFSC
jgi:hypothetical protein